MLYGIGIGKIQVVLVIDGHGAIECCSRRSQDDLSPPLMSIPPCMFQPQRTLVTNMWIPLPVQCSGAAEGSPAPLIEGIKSVDDLEFPFAVNEVSEFQRGSVEIADHGVVITVYGNGVSHASVAAAHFETLIRSFQIDSSPDLTIETGVLQLRAVESDIGELRISQTIDGQGVHLAGKILVVNDSSDPDSISEYGVVHSERRFHIPTEVRRPIRSKSNGTVKMYQSVTWINFLDLPATTVEHSELE